MKATDEQIFAWAGRHCIVGTITAQREAFEDAQTILQEPLQHKPITDFDVRGILAAKLTCWHRLSEAESDELVKLFADHIPDAGKMVDAAQAPYGYCPICHAKGATRERRPNGYDRCVNGHIYPSSQSVGVTKPNHIPDATKMVKPLTDEEIRKMWHKEHKWHKSLSSFEWYMAGVKAAIKEGS